MPIHGYAYYHRHRIAHPFWQRSGEAQEEHHDYKRHIDCFYDQHVLQVFLLLNILESQSLFAPILPIFSGDLMVEVNRISYEPWLGSYSFKDKQFNLKVFISCRLLSLMLINVLRVAFN